MSPSPARPRFALRLTLCSALLGLCLGLNAPARAGSDEQFVAARDAFRAGDLNRLDRLAAELRDHELAPYVEYFQIRAQLEKADANTVAALNDFLARQDKTYIAEKLRGDWLRLLGKQQRWSEFEAERVTGEQPMLVIHDREDREVPFSEGRRHVLNWPGARLQATRGLGHRRLLEDPAVIEAAVDFISGVRS